MKSFVLVENFARVVIFLLFSSCSQKESPSSLLRSSTSNTSNPTSTPSYSSSNSSIIQPILTSTSPTSDSSNSSDKPPKLLLADNLIPGISNEELQSRAKSLFEAIVKDEPIRGESFWFPKEPFIPLKDVKGPEKYWNTLHKTYERDIHLLHKEKKSWEGATFEEFSLGSSPRWVKPGEEANKIGYFRSFHGKIKYHQNGTLHQIDVHTVITWQGDWFCTHLRDFKHPPK